MTARASARSLIGKLALVVALIIGVWAWTAGCGEQESAVGSRAVATTAVTAAAEPTTAAVSTTGVAGAATASSIPTTTTAAPETTVSSGARAVETVFADLAAYARPIAIFAPTYLPEETSLTDTWLPVIDSEDPGSYTGKPTPNPQVLGSGDQTEAQVIFRAGSGWLAIVENFRGDLGDVAGTWVGTVGGNDANLYEVNGGELVQWSQDGLWYGVFGRGVSREEMTRVALGMAAVGSPLGAAAP